MKKTLTIMAVAALATASFAQTVSSANIVGYINDDAPMGYHITGMQFDNPTNTPQTVYGDTLPKGSKIYLFNGLDYDTSTYTDVFDPGPPPGLVTKWTAALELGNGEGYWLQVPGATNAIISGDVPMDDSITNSISEGFSLLSYPYPVDRVVTNLGFAPVKGDKIYAFNGIDYDTSTYTDVFDPGPPPGLVLKWTDPTLAIAAGEGFWYETTNTTTEWVADRPFTP